LNYIAGMLLLVTKDEEDSFWLLVQLVENLVPGKIVFGNIQKKKNSNSLILLLLYEARYIN